MYTAIETTKDAFQILAWICALLYFLFKLVTGYLNSDVCLTCTADWVDDRRVAATLTVKKGSNGGIELHDARAYLNGQCRGESFELIRRVSLQSKYPRFSLPDALDPLDKDIMLFSSGDQMQFVAVLNVEHNGPIVVHAVIVGRQFLVKKGWFSRSINGVMSGQQWHASAVVPVRGYAKAHS
jgi:hypothetical protein